MRTKWLVLIVGVTVLGLGVMIRWEERVHRKWI